MKEECDCFSKEANFFLQLDSKLGFKILASHCESSSLELRYSYYCREVLNGQSSR